MFSFIILPSDTHFSHDTCRHSVFDLPFARRARDGNPGSALSSRRASAVREKTPEINPLFGKSDHVVPAWLACDWNCRSQDLGWNRIEARAGLPGWAVLRSRWVWGASASCARPALAGVEYITRGSVGAKPCCHPQPPPLDPHQPCRRFSPVIHHTDLLAGDEVFVLMPDGKTVATHIEQMAGDDFATWTNLYLDVSCSAGARFTSGAIGLSRGWHISAAQTGAPQRQ
jgi:hypothetical protein